MTSPNTKHRTSSDLTECAFSWLLRWQRKTKKKRNESYCPNSCASFVARHTRQHSLTQTSWSSSCLPRVAVCKQSGKVHQTKKWDFPSTGVLNKSAGYWWTNTHIHPRMHKPSLTIEATTSDSRYHKPVVFPSPYTITFRHTATPSRRHPRPISPWKPT